MPKFGNRAAHQERTEDYPRTEAYDGDVHCVCSFEECFVGAEDCDVEMYDRYFD